MGRHWMARLSVHSPAIPSRRGKSAHVGGGNHAGLHGASGNPGIAVFLSRVHGGEMDGAGGPRDRQRPLPPAGAQGTPFDRYMAAPPHSPPPPALWVGRDGEEGHSTHALGIHWACRGWGGIQGTHGARPPTLCACANPYSPAKRGCRRRISRPLDAREWLSHWTVGDGGIP